MACTTILLCIMLPTYGQTLSPQHFRLRAGDVIMKEQISYKDPGRSGHNVLWDVSEQESVDRQYTISYDSIQGQPGVVSGMEHHTSYYYSQRGDTLCLAGFENRTTKSVYDRQEPLAVFPLVYGTHLTGYFHGRCSSSDRLMMRQFGSYSLDVDATGMLLLPSGDTLRHVTRVHTTRIVDEHLLPFIHSEKELVAWTDSLSPFNADSICHYLQNDSNLVEIHVYRFYASGYRYPVFETVTTGLKGFSPLLATAYYYSPSSQELLDDEDNEGIRRELEEADRRETAQHNVDDGSNEEDTPVFQRDVRFNYNTFLQNGNLNLEFFVGGEAAVIGNLYTTTGILIDSRNESVSAGIYRWTYELNHLQQGVYILSLSVNGRNYSEKIYVRN